MLTEFGIDSMREGEDEQARILSWQVGAAFEMGVAGTFVFAWTDEWFTGGHLIEDWAFGLVDRDRNPKPALRRRCTRAIRDRSRPRCRARRASRSWSAPTTPSGRWTPCLESLAKLNYPDYEVIVVNDGSTDGSLAIAERFGYCKIIASRTKA